MTPFDAVAQQGLLDKLDYEIWVLEFLSNTQGLVIGGADISRIELDNRSGQVEVAVGVHDYSGAGLAQQVLDAIAPLTFTAAYKVLDMVFEWILEQNKAGGVISQVPWKFAEKVSLIKTTSLDYPPLFNSNPYLRDYSFAFFENLLPYRNGVIHNQGSSVSGDQLTLVDRSGNKLMLDRAQLGHLVRYVVAVGETLAGKRSLDDFAERLVKFSLDQLAFIHGRPCFGQFLPLLVKVELTLHKRGETFPADLRFVRGQLQSMYPGRDVAFDLLVHAVDGGRPVGEWAFEAKDVPQDDEVQFTVASYPAFRVA